MTEIPHDHVYASSDDLRAIIEKHGLICTHDLICDLMEYVTDCAKDAADDAHESAVKSMANEYAR